MFNTMLFVLFIGYIISLMIGFNLNKKTKDKNNKQYHKYKFFLLGIICLIFILSSTLILVILETLEWFTYILLLNVVFITYFLLRVEKQTRCWKQHRMIIYNFLIIPIIYLSSLLLNQPLLLLSILIIYSYSIFEFKYAKFDPKRPLIWD